MYSVLAYKSSGFFGAELSTSLSFFSHDAKINNKDKIEIEREIDYINQYLDLEQIRYGEKFYVEKEFLIENSKKLIHPYIISPLIENAIKHGVVKDINHPIVVHINTKKGKGYKLAEENKENWHWTMPFDRETGKTTVNFGDGEDYLSLTSDLLLDKM